MGRDKALIEVDGRPMARRVADALQVAGATEIVAVGGDPAALRSLDLTVVPDDPMVASRLRASPPPADLRPLGPLGPLVGVVTALGALSSGIVLVVACDLVTPSPAAMAATVDALAEESEHDLAVPLDAGGVPQWLHAAWRRSVRDRLVDALVAGHRSIHGAVTSARLRTITVRDLPSAALTDADVPGQLPRQAD